MYGVDIKILCTNNCFLPHICFSGTGQLGNTDVEDVVTKVFHFSALFSRALPVPCRIYEFCLISTFQTAQMCPCFCQEFILWLLWNLACTLGRDLLKSSAKNLNTPNCANSSIKWLCWHWMYRGVSSSEQPFTQ